MCKNKADDPIAPYDLAETFDLSLYDPTQLQGGEDESRSFMIFLITLSASSLLVF